MMPPGFAPYALEVALVVSAMTVAFDSVESNISTRLPTMSLTITWPSGSCRTSEIAPRGSLATAVTGPSWRTGGSDCAESLLKQPRLECGDGQDLLL